MLRSAAVFLESSAEPERPLAADLVELNADHPGFSDAAYRSRRNEIARIALAYREGDPVPPAEYTAEEQAVWRDVWGSLQPVHERRACRAYVEVLKAVALPKHRIPQLHEVNEVILPMAGFSMQPVAGLVSARTFLSALSRGAFLSTQYIRHHSVPLYTPEPDVVHELVGHAATLGHPDFAELNRSFGEAARKAGDREVLWAERLYWYTMEFGVVREDGELKAFGAGLLSSFGELGGLEDGPELRRFDVQEVIHTSYDPTQYQSTLFVADSFSAMSAAVRSFLDQLGKS